ncbi:conserved hypothetical protein [Thermotomaculum hydrothermale]|uniref:DUF2207 domain-containing protein n=1 Tax=Thermotomaculum hydrothermale TaxID=981385 RepID=A0A7R6SYT1_9BACT|nr:DUF2207 domain-containing protein [Thermotomaculum hydrothermale]BBB32145.1 conserved hypothetical protein [Thermotomaculum hydrothermale]
MKHLFSVLLLCFLALSLFASEEILDYQSDITIGRDNTLLVIESITVRAEGKKIKRGIYREFPTDYVDSMGRRVKVRFKVESVERNGERINYWVERRVNGYRVYMGSKNYYLKPGVYTFRLTYITDRQIGFFKDHDELYWNVTGQGWIFPIKQVTAYVSLPEGCKTDDFLKWTAYTGYRGSREKSFKAYFDTMGRLVFESTRPLSSNEGMTIVVAFRKGIVHEPSAKEKMMFILEDNKNILGGLIGLLIVLLYYLIVWFYVGRDPEKGPIVPQFEPPDNLSPAQVCYIAHMGYSIKCLLAALVNMAIKGVLKIKEEDNIFALKRKSTDTSNLSPEELKLFGSWLAIGGYFKFKQSNYAEIQDGIKGFKKILKNTLEGTYFHSNSKFLIPGIILSLFTLFVIAIYSRIPPVAGFILFWLSFWTFGVVAIWSQFISSLKSRTSIVNIIGLGLVSILFTLGEFGGFFMLTKAASVEAGFIVVALAIVNILFFYLIKAPTRYGRRVMDKIEGLKLYLSMAEDDYIKYKLKFTKDVNTFKWFLPYAIALGVEKKWSEKFEGAIDKAALSEHFEGSRFYAGGFFATNFSSTFASSMSSAISSSSSAPDSSSGFSGGGGAGGGGGGGGGGGF